MPLINPELSKLDEKLAIFLEDNGILVKSDKVPEDDKVKGITFRNLALNLKEDGSPNGPDINDRLQGPYVVQGGPKEGKLSFYRGMYKATKLSYYRVSLYGDIEYDEYELVIPVFWHTGYCEKTSAATRLMGDIPTKFDIHLIKGQGRDGYFTRFYTGMPIGLPSSFGNCQLSLGFSNAGDVSTHGLFYVVHPKEMVISQNEFFQHITDSKHTFFFANSKPDDEVTMIKSGLMGLPNDIQQSDLWKQIWDPISKEITDEGWLILHAMGFACTGGVHLVGLGVVFALKHGGGKKLVDLADEKLNLSGRLREHLSDLNGKFGGNLQFVAEESASDANVLSLSGSLKKDGCSGRSIRGSQSEIVYWT